MTIIIHYNFKKGKTLILLIFFLIMSRCENVILHLVLGSFEHIHKFYLTYTDFLIVSRMENVPRNETAARIKDQRTRPKTSRDMIQSCHLGLFLTLLQLSHTRNILFFTHVCLSSFIPGFKYLRFLRNRCRFFIRD